MPRGFSAEQEATFNAINYAAVKAHQAQITPQQFMQTVNVGNTASLNQTLQKIYDQAASMYSQAGQNTSSVPKPPSYENIKDLTNAQRIADDYAKTVVPDTFNVNTSLQEVYDAAIKAGIPAANIPKLPAYTQLFINKDTAQAKIDEYVNSIPQLLDINKSLQEVYDAAVKMGIPTSSIPKPPTTSTAYVDKIDNAKAKAYIDAYIAKIPQVYDVSADLKAVQADAKAKGITDIPALPKITGVVISEAVAQKYVSDYVDKINAGIKTSNATNATTTTTTTVDGYTPVPSMQNIYDDLTKQGYSNVPAVPKDTKVYTTEVEARAAAQKYVDTVNATQLLTGFDTVRNQITTGDKAGAVATANKYGGSTSIDPQKTGGYNFVSELNDRATGMLKEAQKANPALTEYQWRKNMIDTLGADNADAKFFGDRPDVFAFDNASKGAFGLMTMQTPSQAYIQPEIIGNLYNTGNKVANVGNSTTANMTTSQAMTYLNSAEYKAGLKTQGQITQGNTTLHVDSKPFTTQQTAPTIKTTVPITVTQLTTSQKLDFLNSAEYKAGLSTQGQIISSQVPRSTVSPITTGNSAMAKYNRALIAEGVQPNKIANVTNNGRTASEITASLSSYNQGVSHYATNNTPTIVKVINPVQQAKDVANTNLAINVQKATQAAHTPLLGGVDGKTAINQIEGTKRVIDVNGNVTYVDDSGVKIISPVTLTDTQKTNIIKKYKLEATKAGISEEEQEATLKAYKLDNAAYTRGFEGEAYDVDKYNNYTRLVSNPFSIEGSGIRLAEQNNKMMTTPSNPSDLVGAIPFRTVDQMKIDAAEAKGGWWGAISSKSLKLDAELRGALTTEAVINKELSIEKYIGSRIFPDFKDPDVREQRSALFTSLGIEDERKAITASARANPWSNAVINLNEKAYNFMRDRPVTTAAIVAGSIYLAGLEGAGFGLLKMGLRSPTAYGSAFVTESAESALTGAVARNGLARVLGVGTRPIISGLTKVLGEDAVRASVTGISRSILGTGKALQFGVDSYFWSQIGSSVVDSFYGKDTTKDIAMATTAGSMIGYSSGGLKGAAIGGTVAASTSIALAKTKPLDYESGVGNVGTIVATLPFFVMGEGKFNRVFNREAIEATSGAKVAGWSHAKTRDFNPIHSEVNPNSGKFNKQTGKVDPSTLKFNVIESKFDPKTNKFIATDKTPFSGEGTTTTGGRSVIMSMDGTRVTGKDAWIDVVGKDGKVESKNINNLKGRVTTETINGHEITYKTLKGSTINNNPVRKTTIKNGAVINGKDIKVETPLPKISSDAYLRNLRVTIGDYAATGTYTGTPIKSAASFIIGKPLTVVGKATGFIKSSTHLITEEPYHPTITRGAEFDYLTSGESVSGVRGSKINYLIQNVEGSPVGIHKIPVISPHITEGHSTTTGANGPRHGIRIPFTDKIVDLSAKNPLTGTRVGLSVDVSHITTGRLPRNIMGTLPDSIHGKVQSILTKPLEKWSKSTNSEAKSKDIKAVSNAVKAVLSNKEQYLTREYSDTGRITGKKNYGFGGHGAYAVPDVHNTSVGMYFVEKGSSSRLTQGIDRVSGLPSLKDILTPAEITEFSAQMSKYGRYKTDLYIGAGKKVIDYSRENNVPVPFFTPKMASGHTKPEGEMLLIFGSKKATEITSSKTSGFTENGVRIRDVKFGDQAPIKGNVLTSMVENAKYNWKNALTGKGEDVKGMATKANRRNAEINGTALSRPQEFKKGYSTNPTEHTAKVESNMEEMWKSSKVLQSKYTLPESKISGRMHDNERLFEKETEPIEHGKAMKLSMKKGLIDDPEFNAQPKASQNTIAENIGTHTHIKPVTLENLATDFTGTVKSALITRPTLGQKALANADRLARAAEQAKKKGTTIAEEVRRGTIFKLPMDKDTAMNTLINGLHANGGVQPNIGVFNKTGFNKFMKDERAGVSISSSKVDKIVSEKRNMPIADEKIKEESRKAYKQTTADKTDELTGYKSEYKPENKTKASLYTIGNSKDKSYSPLTKPKDTGYSINGKDTKLPTTDYKKNNPYETKDKSYVKPPTGNDKLYPDYGRKKNPPAYPVDGTYKKNPFEYTPDYTRKGGKYEPIVKGGKYTPKPTPSKYTPDPIKPTPTPPPPPDKKGDYYYPTPRREDIIPPRKDDEEKKIKKPKNEMWRQDALIERANVGGFKEIIQNGRREAYEPPVTKKPTMSMPKRNPIQLVSQPQRARTVSQPQKQSQKPSSIRAPPQKGNFSNVFGSTKSKTPSTGSLMSSTKSKAAKQSKK